MINPSCYGKNSEKGVAPGPLPHMSVDVPMLRAWLVEPGLAPQATGLGG